METRPRAGFHLCPVWPIPNGGPLAVTRPMAVSPSAPFIYVIVYITWPFST